MIEWLIQAHTLVIQALGGALEHAGGVCDHGAPAARKNQKILVVKTDKIGDFVLATSFFRELRLLFPAAHITLVVNPVTFPLAEPCPYVDQVIAHRRNSPLYVRPFTMPWHAFRLGCGRLRPERFDLAIVPRWDVDGYYMAHIAFFSGARRRVGYSADVYPQKSKRNRGYNHLYTDALDPRVIQHEVEHYLDLIRFLGGEPSSGALELWTRPEDDGYAAELIKRVGGQVWVALGPGADLAARRWPADRFIRVGRWLAERYCAGVVILGGEEDTGLGRAIREGIGDGAMDLTGRTTLRQTAAILRKCALFVGNDTGSMHMAAAVGVPVVEISCFSEGGPVWHWNSPYRVGPWGVRRRVLQPKRGAADLQRKPSALKYSDAIRDITVEEVQGAIAELLEDYAQPEKIHRYRRHEEP